ncbi:hypothetical protein SLA2020_273790 [Shorea laevis]
MISEGTGASCAVEKGFRDVEKIGLEIPGWVRVGWGVLWRMKLHEREEGMAGRNRRFLLATVHSYQRR